MPNSRVLSQAERLSVELAHRNASGTTTCGGEVSGTVFSDSPLIDAESRFVADLPRDDGGFLKLEVALPLAAVGSLLEQGDSADIVVLAPLGPVRVAEGQRVLVVHLNRIAQSQTAFDTGALLSHSE